MRSLVEREECLTRAQRSWEIWRSAELAGHDARDQSCFEARRFRAAMASGLPNPKRSRLTRAQWDRGDGDLSCTS
jgi:hypothetical protein